jgi:hypothetical protein
MPDPIPSHETQTLPPSPPLPNDSEAETLPPAAPADGVTMAPEPGVPVGEGMAVPG